MPPPHPRRPWRTTLLRELNRPRLESSNLLDERLFSFLLDREVQKAARLQYCVSLFCITPDRAEATAEFMSRLARASIEVLRVTDAACSFGVACAATLLVGAQTQDLRAIHGRLREALERGVGVTTSAGGGCYPKTASTASRLVQQAVDLMVRAKTEGGNRLYLP
jgi:hypothetical protein